MRFFRFFVYVSILGRPVAVPSDSEFELELAAKGYGSIACTIGSTCPSKIDDLLEAVKKERKGVAKIREPRTSLFRICCSGAKGVLCGTSYKPNIMIVHQEMGWFGSQIIILGNFDPRIGVRRDTLDAYPIKNNVLLIITGRDLVFMTPKSANNDEFTVMELLRIANKVSDQQA